MWCMIEFLFPFVVASNAPGGVGTTGVYHQQAPLPPTERAPIPANEYEPLSDDDM